MILLSDVEVKLTVPMPLVPAARTAPLSLFTNCHERMLPTEPEASLITTEPTVTFADHFTESRPVASAGDQAVAVLPSMA